MGCFGSTEGSIFKSPTIANMMQGVMRSDMNGLMKVTAHNNDCTQKEVADFMVPSSIGKPFKDAPGTFDPKMEGRIKDTAKGGFMVMHRTEMVKAGAPHNKGITWEKYNEHRGYTTPGYVEKSPNVGDVAVDGTIKSISGGADSTLLAEARRMAKEAGSKIVVLSFDGITCPFYRGYAAEDLFKVTNGVPILHVYLREAEPCDVFDAGGMHMTTPLAIARPIKWHKSAGERAQAAKDTKAFFEGKFMGQGNCNMWMDTMDDTLEAAYEARPWRLYVIEADSGRITCKLGLAPFNMEGKIASLKAACKTGGK